MSKSKSMSVEELREVYKKLPKNNFFSGRDRQHKDRTSKVPEIVDTKENLFTSLSSIPIKSTRWVIDDWLPEPKFSLLMGAPNCGKNTLLYSLSAAISNGRDHSLWGGETTNGSGDVLILTTEDEFEDTVIPKLRAAGANMDRISKFKGITEWTYGVGNSVRDSTFSEEDNKFFIEQCRNHEKDWGLIAIDPISQVIRGNVVNDFKVRKDLERLCEFSKLLNCAVLGVVHTAKSTKGKPLLSRIAGPGAFSQVARSVMYVSKIEGGPMDDGATHVLVLAKSYGKPINYGPTYSIQTTNICDQDGNIVETSKIVWHGLIKGTADEIIKWAENVKKEIISITPLDFAINFLKDALKSGPVWSQEVEKQAKQEVISTRNLAHAKKKLGMVHFKREGERYGRTYWSLPDNSP